jgi:hypothetical protein
LQIRVQASSALLLVASAVEKASTFDKDYEVTKGLAQALHGAYAHALGLLAQIQVRLLWLHTVACVCMLSFLAAFGGHDLKDSVLRSCTAKLLREHWSPQKLVYRRQHQR